MKWRAGLGVLLVAGVAHAAPEPLVLINGTVYTVDDKNPRAEAVVAVDGRITYVGTTAEALKRAPAGARQIDVRGQTVFPGLTDAHAHLLGIGEREERTPLEPARRPNRRRASLRRAGE